MTTEDILDEFTVDGHEVEMSMIETAGRAIKTLKLMEKDHVYKRDAAEDRAREMMSSGDEEAYHRWMDVFLREDSSVRFIRDTLNNFNIR